MAEQDPQFSKAESYTEATHTAYCDVTGADPLLAGTRYFRPERITVKYHWRTQLGHDGWTIGNIEISGPWRSEATNPQGTQGSGRVILGGHNSPAWARAFADANFPTSALVDWTTK